MQQASEKREVESMSGRVCRWQVEEVESRDMEDIDVCISLGVKPNIEHLL